MSASLRVLDVGPANAVAVAGNLIVCVNNQPPPPELVNRIARLIDEVGAQHPTGVGCMLVIQASAEASPPSEETRRAFIALLRGAGPAKAAMVVIERQGFAGAAIRAIVSGVLLAARAKVPTRVFARVDEGAPWFIRTLRDAGAAAPSSASELDAIVAEVRRGLAAP